MVFGSNWISHFGKSYIDPPTSLVPLCTYRPKLFRSCCVVAIRLSDSNRRNQSAPKRKNRVAWSDFPHVLVKLVACVIFVPLRRPQVTAWNFSLVRLVLIDPPVTHGHYASA